MPCKMIVHNKTPPEWQLKIIEGGAVFNFREGGTYNDGPRGMSVGSGGSVEFNTPEAKCTFEVFVALKVDTPLEPESKNVNFTNTANPNKCFSVTSGSLVQMPRILGASTDNEKSSGEVVFILEASEESDQ